MYKGINDLNNTKWIARLFITFNFIFSMVVKSRSEYFIEGFLLVLFAIWLTWFNKHLLAILFMIICLYTFYLHW
jgi:hypothetical protein